MKRILSAVLIMLVMIGCLSACEARVGSTIKKPESAASLDQNAITIRSTVTAKQSGAVTEHIFAYRKNGERQTYYAKTVREGDEAFYNEIYGYVEGENQPYYTRPTAGEQFTLLQNPVSEFGSTKEYYEYLAAQYGFNATKVLKVTEFVKKEDAKAMNKDCYVYTVKYTDINKQRTADIYIDKETGIWLKQVSKEGDETYTTEVTEITYDAAVIPGTTPVEMDEQVIYNKNDITITAKSLTFDDPNYGAVLTLETQNNSDSDITFRSLNFNVNSLYLGERIISDTCETEDSVTTKVNLPLNTLEISEISQIATISFPLCIQNISTRGSNTEYGDYVEQQTEMLTITTKGGADYTQKVNTEGKVLLDEKDVKLVFQQCQVDATSGDTMFIVYCENGYKENIRITVDFIKINGKEFAYYDKIYMAAGCKGKGGFSLSQSDLKSIGVSEIESMEFTCSAYYGALYNSDNLIPKTDPITVTIEK